MKLRHFHRNTVIILSLESNSPQDERLQYTPLPSLPVHSRPVIPSVPDTPHPGPPFTFLSLMVPQPIAPSLLYFSSLCSHPTSTQRLSTHHLFIPSCSGLPPVSPQPHSTCLITKSLVIDDFLAPDLHMGRRCHGAKIHKKPRGTQTSTVCWKHTGRSASGRAR